MSASPLPTNSGLAMALLLAFLGTAEARYYPRDAVTAEQRALRTLPADPALRLQSARLLAAADPLAGELALHAALLALRDLPPAPQLRAAVEPLQSYEPQARTDLPDPDHGRGLTAPVVDIAGAAAGTLRAWTLRENVELYRSALLQARLPAPAGPHDDEALALAIAALPAATLPGIASALAGTLPPRAQRALAARAPSAALYRAVLASGDERETLLALPELARNLPAHEAIGLLIAATGDERLGSAAVLALAPLAGTPAAHDFLLDRLGDPRLGGSCAQALAAAPDRPAIGALSQRAASGRDDLAARRALLALRLMEDPESRRALRALAADARVAPALRAEIEPWLR